MITVKLILSHAAGYEALRVATGFKSYFNTSVKHLTDDPSDRRLIFVYMFEDEKDAIMFRLRV